MKESGIVQTIKDGEVLVKLKRHAACLGCRACSMSSSGEMVIKAKTIVPDKVNIGDKVTIEIDSTSIIKAITLIYLLPAVAFLIGVFAGLKIALLSGIYKHKEVFSVFIGVALLSTSLFLARCYGIKKGSAYQARIIEKIPSLHAGED